MSKKQVVKLSGSALESDRSFREALAFVFDQVNARFVGREKDLKALDTVFSHSTNTIERAALHGLRGMGKTTLALEYANRWRHRYNHIFFISAKDPIGFQTEYGNLCGYTKTEDVTRWLKARTDSGRWLLIVDDVVEETKNLVQSLPSPDKRTGYAGFGHVLFTTVSEELAKTSLTKKNTLLLQDMERKDVEDLFMSVSGSLYPDCDEVIDLMPRSPIAVVQLAKNSFHDGIKPNAMKNDLKSPNTTATALKRGKNVKEICEMTIARLESLEDGLKHLQLLAILSYLHTNSFDLNVLESMWQHGISPRLIPEKQCGKQLRYLGFRRQRAPTFQEALEEKLSQLRGILPETCSQTFLGQRASLYNEMSLLQRNGMSVAIPDMFQDLILDRICELNPSGAEVIFSLSLALVFKVAEKKPWLESTRERGRHFSSVVRSLMRHAQHATEPWQHVYLTDLNFHAGWFLGSQMWTAQGCNHYALGFKHWNTLPNPNPNRLLRPAHNYALLLIQEGDYRMAEEYLSLANRGFKRLRGEKNAAERLRVKYNRLVLLQAQGFPGKAEIIAKKMLKPSSLLFWPKDISFQKRIELTQMLAHHTREQGKYREAMAILETVLSELKVKETRVLMGGDADSSLVSTLQTVAQIHMNLGNYDEADSMACAIATGTSSISILRSILGANFEPSTDKDSPQSEAFLKRVALNAQINIAASFVEQELYQDAIDYTGRVMREVEERGRSIGRSTELVLTEVSALARAFAGEHLTAQEDFEFLCQKYETQEKQGFYPQGAIRVREGLALAKGLGGDLKAKGDFLEVISLSKKHLGERHPDLYTTYHRLGMVLEDQGEIEEAMDWYRKAFDGKVQTLGAEHLLTFQSGKAWCNLQQKMHIQYQ